MASFQLHSSRCVNWNVCSIVLIGILAILSFSDSTDAKGIKVGGVKLPKPPTPKAPKPPGGTVLLPIPVPIPVPGPGRPRPTNSNKRLKCYSCIGSNNDLCAINPAANAKKVTCASNHYCSVIRKEVPVVAGSNLNDTDISILLSDLNKQNISRAGDEPDEFIGPFNSTILETDDFVVNSTDILAENGYVEADNSSISLIRSIRASTRVVIQRGCKSADLLEGTLLSSSTTNSTNNNNQTEKAYAQLCSTDLCNTGDGRLRCYKCEGKGINHSCMVKPSDVAEVVMCESQESCFVERKSIKSSTNSTDYIVAVSRGCKTVSSLVENKITSRNSNRTKEMTCRINDLCNAFDANKLVRSNSATGNAVSLLILFLTVMFTQL